MGWRRSYSPPQLHPAAKCLEVHVSSSLEAALSECAADLPKAATADTGASYSAVRARVEPVRRVGEIQHLCPSLQLEPLRELEGTEEAEVKVHQAGTSQPRQPPAAVADLHGLYRSKGRSIEPLFTRDRKSTRLNSSHPSI